MRIAAPSFVMSCLFLSVWMVACGEARLEKSPRPVASDPDEATSAAVALDGDRVLLARVNGSPITEYDLEQSIRSTLGTRALQALDDAGRQKVLESLVASRAIAQAQEPRLSARDQAVLERKLQAYREELLVMQYLGQNAPPRPVTQEMVRDYYESHPERFGGKTIRGYEMIMSTRSLKGEERDALIELLRKPDEQEDWQGWVGMLQGKGYPVAYREGQAAEKALHSQLRELMRSLGKGEASQLSFIKGHSYVVRVVDERMIPPRPLGEVSAEVRRSLAPVQLKNAVKRAAEEVLKTAEVLYEDGNEGRE